MRRVSGVLLAPLALPCAAHAQDVPSRPYLTLEAAQVGAQSCLAFAREGDLRVAVAVRDRSGRDVLLLDPVTIAS